MLYFATAEQRATIKRLSTEVIWQTAFNDWLETRFGRDHSIDPRDGAKVVIDALKSKLRNQKRGMAISDWKQPASADQLAMIKRALKAYADGIRPFMDGFGRRAAFNKWNCTGKQSR